jgi:hypothetical protein
MAVVGMTNETNRLANGYQVAIDDRFRPPAPVEGPHGESPVAASVPPRLAPHPRRQNHPRADGAPGKRACPHGCVHSTLESRGQAQLSGHRPAYTHTVRCPFRCTKEPFRWVNCSNQQRTWRKHEGDRSRKRLTKQSDPQRFLFDLIPRIAVRARHRRRRPLIRKSRFGAQCRRGVGLPENLA